MDRIDEMRVFARVVETRSFRAAARALNLPPSSVSDAVKRAEARLGARLLDRTTRVVAPTLDGDAWYRRCLAIIAAVEDAEAAFRGDEPEGRVRLDVHGSLARNFLLPRLPAFLERYPALDFVLSEGDRLVDLLREGVDCVVRAGQLDDSDLVRRSLGALPEATVATPDYLAKHGTPRSLEELDGHFMVGFYSSRINDVLPLDFVVDGRMVEKRLPTSLVLTGGETLLEAVRLGLGIGQGPRYRMAEDIAAGRLVEILPERPPTPLQLAALYPRDRQLTPRVRAVLDWLSEIDFSAQ